MAQSVLLVEDDRSIATVITEALREEGFEVVSCDTIARRDALLGDGVFDVMLTDVMLADGDGLASIDAVRRMAPDMPVIVLSAQNTLDTAVRASDSEAFEYFPKPFDLDELTQAVSQAVASRPQVEGAGENEDSALPLIGRSPAMQGVFRMITRVLRNDLTVLITGESGTGKELVAEAVHQLGSRKTGPFVAVNMAAIPHDLLESELFGHERGAFTGAVGQQIGKFEQTRLLRALQSGRIRRVGGRQEIGVDVRIVAATNKDLAPMIAEGRFREDLYYRLNVVPIHLPPLRERHEDIGALVRHFLGQAANEGLPARQANRDAIAALETRDWRGNVRELRNAVFRLALMAREDVIDRVAVEDILPPIRETGAERTGNGFETAVETWIAEARPADGAVYHAALAAFEKPLFELALDRTEGNQLRAARLLGINRNTLRKRLSELDIAPEAFSRRG